MSLLVARVRVFLVGWLSVGCDGIDMKSVLEIGSGWLLFSLSVRVWREGDEGGGGLQGVPACGEWKLPSCSCLVVEWG